MVILTNTAKTKWEQTKGNQLTVLLPSMKIEALKVISLCRCQIEDLVSVYPFYDSSYMMLSKYYLTYLLYFVYSFTDNYTNIIS